LNQIKLFVLGFFKVVLEVLNLEVLVLEVLVLEVLLVVDARENVGDEIGIFVVLEEVRQGILAPFPPFGPVVFLPIVTLVIIVPVVVPVVAIARVFIVAATPVIFVILPVVSTLAPPTASLDVSVGGYIRQDLREDVALSAVPAKTVVRDQMVTENNG
jgi:hypothetical protein